MTLLIVAPDHLAARKIARDHGLLRERGAATEMADDVRVVTRAAQLVGWSRKTPVIFFDLAFWPANQPARCLMAGLLAGIQSGRLRIASAEDIAVHEIASRAAPPLRGWPSGGARNDARAPVGASSRRWA
ncbi:MAG: hypothetical protein ACXIVF_15535 [Rhizobiaceae bacterium]